MLAWWKVANFVQSLDTAMYYQRLINAAVRSPESIHAWPRGIIGVTIDAHDISDSKANPSIDFDCEPGFDPPPDNKERNTTLQVKSLATGGTPMPGQAQKRARQMQAEPNQNTAPPQPTQTGTDTAPLPAAPAPEISGRNAQATPVQPRERADVAMNTEGGEPQAYEISPIAITGSPKRHLVKYFPSPTPARRNPRNPQRAAASASTSTDTTTRPAPDDPNGAGGEGRVEVHN